MGIQPIQIVMIVSAVLGQLLLVTSALGLDENQARFDDCNDYISDAAKVSKLARMRGIKLSWDTDPCESHLLIMIGGTFGLIAAIIQILSAAICFQKLRVVPWCGATIAVFIFSIIAFSLPMSTKALTDEHEGILTMRSRAANSSIPLSNEAKQIVMKTEFFLAVAGMDFCFALLAIAFGAFTIIRSKAAVGVAGAPSNVGVVGAPPSKSSHVGGKRISARPIPPSNPEPDTTGAKV